MRDLKKGDRVKITGPCRPSENFGIGDIEVVISIDATDRGLPVLLKSGYWWCRENLRALPRK